MVEDWWQENLSAITRCGGPVDLWHSQSSSLRQFLKGWGNTLGKQSRVAKSNLLAKIQALDTAADGPGLDEDGWALKYHLEGQMMETLSAEEECWRQRGKQQ
jgi:hypothetical protein